MVDQVAKALCEAAGRSVSPECSCCEVLSDGSRRCVFWESFRDEARVAIVAAFKWNKQERRWPSFCREA